MQHFLLIYDLKAEELRETRQFSEKECDDATAAYQQAETDFRNDPNVQIVLIGSDSLDTIKRTHGHYFGDRKARSKYLTAVG